METKSFHKQNPPSPLGAGKPALFFYYDVNFMFKYLTKMVFIIDSVNINIIVN